jgi:hypothetical protein
MISLFVDFAPAANPLITIPFANDRLVLRRLDIRQTLEKLASTPSG